MYCEQDETVWASCLHAFSLLELDGKEVYLPICGTTRSREAGPVHSECRNVLEELHMIVKYSERCLEAETNSNSVYQIAYITIILCPLGIFLIDLSYWMEHGATTAAVGMNIA